MSKKKEREKETQLHSLFFTHQFRTFEILQTKKFSYLHCINLTRAFFLVQAFNFIIIKKNNKVLSMQKLEKKQQ
jgi:hypothetical protein